MNEVDVYKNKYVEKVYDKSPIRDQRPFYLFIYFIGK